MHKTTAETPEEIRSIRGATTVEGRTSGSTVTYLIAVSNISGGSRISMMGCTNSRGRCANLFGKNLVENCIKMKEIGLRGGHAYLALSLGSANECKVIK